MWWKEKACLREGGVIVAGGCVALMYSVQSQRRQGGQRTLTFIAGAGVTALCLSLGSPLSPGSGSGEIKCQQ